MSYTNMWNSHNNLICKNDTSLLAVYVYVGQLGDLDSKIKQCLKYGVITAHLGNDKPKLVSDKR